MQKHYSDKRLMILSAHCVPANQSETGNFGAAAFARYALRRNWPAEP
jgi:hypothetical protein